MQRETKWVSAYVPGNSPGRKGREGKERGKGKEREGKERKICLRAMASFSVCPSHILERACLFITSQNIKAWKQKLVILVKHLRAMEGKQGVSAVMFCLPSSQCFI